MEKRKRPKLKSGKLASGAVFYFYLRPSSNASKAKAQSKVATTISERTPKKK